MIILRLTGGLGNQMFQYAFAKKAAFLCKTRIKFDIEEFGKPWVQPHEYYQLGIFYHINCQTSTKKKNFFYRRKTFFKSKFLLDHYKTCFNYNIVKEEEFSYKPYKLTECKKNSYIDGYWQSENYFKDIKDRLLADFTFPELSGKNEDISQIIESTNSISLHIRRGDFLGNSMHGACSLAYYAQAIDMLMKRANSLHFFVFSDDVEWVRLNLKAKVKFEFIDWNKDKLSFCDMHLMSLCKHNIIANSSFSWWGAWLNQNPDKIVIAPKKWFNNRDWDMSNLLPSNWIQL